MTCCLNVHAINEAILKCECHKSNSHNMGFMWWQDYGNRRRRSSHARSGMKIGYRQKDRWARIGNCHDIRAGIKWQSQYNRMTNGEDTRGHTVICWQNMPSCKSLISHRLSHAHSITVSLLQRTWTCSSPSWSVSMSDQRVWLAENRQKEGTARLY